MMSRATVNIGAHPAERLRMIDIFGWPGIQGIAYGHENVRVGAGREAASSAPWSFFPLLGE